MSVHRDLPDVSSTDTEVKYGVAASAAMACAVVAARNALAETLSGKTLAFAVCAVVIPVACVFYYAMLKILRFKRTENIEKILFRKIRE